MMKALIGTPEERRARKLESREKQRATNIGKATDMHAARLENSGCKRVWAYFNNDRDACAIKNARELALQLGLEQRLL